MSDCELGKTLWDEFYRASCRGKANEERKKWGDHINSCAICAANHQSPSRDQDRGERTPSGWYTQKSNIYVYDIRGWWVTDK